MSYLTYFILSAGLAAILTPLIKKFAVKIQVLDFPTQERKIHKTPTPLLGGLAIFLSFAIMLLVFIKSGRVDFHIVPLKFLLATLGGGALLILGGVIDDKYTLPAKISWIFPALASAVVVWSGIGVGIKQLSNPFGHPISLNNSLFSIPFSAVFIWAWCMGMIYTTKFLDGLDGLTAGISLIGGLTLFALSLTEKINQPITATLAIIFAGSLFGYLFFAFHPASVFLGEGGSTFTGFILAVVAVILGGKIATALLVMGIPILDVVWVIVRRLWYKRSPFVGDRQHLHFRLFDIGFSQRQSVLILWLISAIFGAAAIFLQTYGKLIALAILFLLMIILAVFVVVMYKRKHPHIPDLFDYAGEKHRVNPHTKPR